MRNLWLITLRELGQRLRRPSFWVLTLLVPLVLAALYALPVVASQRGADPVTVLVVDQTGLFDGQLVSTPDIRYHSMPSLDYAEQQRASSDVVLFIPLRDGALPREAFLYYHGTPPPLAVQSAVDARLQALLQNAILEDVYGVSPEVYHSVEAVHLRLHTQEAASGHDSFLRVRGVVALALAILMALALILFGLQAMRSVQAERQNRVAELLLTSVRPLQLLGGKVGGVALTAVVQLALWLALTAAAVAGIQAAAPDLFAQARSQQEAPAIATRGAEATALYDTPVRLVDDTLQGLAAIDLTLSASMFVLFFLLGLTLYGSLLAALAARLESDADALQWTLLVGSPLLLTLLLAHLAVDHGGLGLLLTLCPFTAPVAVVARLPFGLPAWQVVVAALLLLFCALAAAWLAARTYRRHPVDR